MRTKIIQRTKIIGLLTCFCLFGFSCVDYDLNQPKYLPQEITLEDFMINMQNVVNPVQVNQYQHNNSMIGDCYGRYMSITNPGWLENFSNFNAKADWIASPFKDVFTNFYPAWTEVEERTEAKGEIYAWAKILRAAAMHRMTDMYGPIPYSRVGEGTLGSPYDSQEDVYEHMFKDLDDAIVELTKYVETYPGEKLLPNGDIVYGGNMVQWVKFANSLKLRMAMRIVYADPTLAQQKAEEAINNTIGPILDIADNATIKYVPNPILILWDDYVDTRVCADIASYMNGYEDPRRAQYFQKSKGAGFPDFHGLRTGINIKSQAWALTYSAPNISEREEPLMWLNAAEVAFLRAEGSLRQWNMGGTVQGLYDEGIRLSFQQYGVLPEAAAYIANTTLKPAGYDDPDGGLKESAQSTITIKWEGSSSPEIQLERIITQKWIAMWPLGQEAWAEQRRTGYPRFFKVLENRNSDQSLSTKFAARIPFSPDEKNNNKVNYENAVQQLGGADTYATKLWWDKNTNKP